jgi:hypothetical protein
MIGNKAPCVGWSLKAAALFPALPDWLGGAGLIQRKNEHVKKKQKKTVLTAAYALDSCRIT